MFKILDRQEGSVVENQFITTGRQLENNKTTRLYLLIKLPWKKFKDWVDPIHLKLAIGWFKPTT
jgi:hypothetical protein